MFFQSSTVEASRFGAKIQQPLNERSSKIFSISYNTLNLVTITPYGGIMSRAALLRATCLSGLALAASITPAVALDLVLNGGEENQYFGSAESYGQIIVGDQTGVAKIVIWNDFTMSSGTSILGNSADADGNQAIVSGTWNTTGNFILGDEGSNNTLTIQAGGKATAGDIFVGNTGQSNENEVTVTGTGSKLSVIGTDPNAIDGYLAIGGSGSQNKLVVENGGRIEVAHVLSVGWQSGSNNNSAVFRGAATGPFVQAAIDFTLELGNQGQSNRVEVRDGANVWTGSEITIGRFGSDNSMLVDGRFSDERRSTIETDIIYVGMHGGSNTLTISNGARALSNYGIIGRFAAASANQAIVSGEAEWNLVAGGGLSGGLVVGDNGSLNILEVSEGGKVTAAGRLYVGGDINSSGSTPIGNRVLVSGSSVDGVETRLISGGLTVGWLGNENRIEVFNGGLLETRGNAQIGNAATRDNSVIVSDAGSQWKVLGDLGIGQAYMSPGSLTVANQPAADNSNYLSIQDGGSVDVDFDLAVLGNSVLDLGAGATLTAGTLTLSDDTLLSIYLDDKRNSSIDIDGTASLDGDLGVKLGTADLQDNRYTVLTAGNVTGTFDSYSLIPVYDMLSLAMNALEATIEYTDTGVFILFDSDIGGDEDLNINQSNVSDAINRYFNGGGRLPEEFVALFGLSGDALRSALDETTGEVGATGGANQMQQGQNAFLGLMVQQDATAPQGSDALASSATSIYGMTVIPTADAAPSSGWSMWGSAFGGTSSLPGADAVGSHDTDTDLIGLATGWDYAFSNDASFGFAIAGGGTRWDLADGLGNGESTFLQFGARGTQHIGASYLSLAGAYAWHWMETERRTLGDTLKADFAASSLAGRLEGGHRFGEKGDLGLTPYAALTAQAAFLPDYEESGGSAALAFEEKTATSVRSELGLRFDMTADTVRLHAGLAWAHDWRSDANADAAFRSLPGASFTVNGAEAPDDIALVTAGAEFGLGSQTTLSARFDGEFGQDYQSYGGTLALSYNW